MGIFEAEVRGKSGEEDILTSGVFGALDILDKHKVLAPFIELLGVPLDKEEVPSLTLKLWRTYGSREPDVILETTRQLIFIEVKLESLADAQQLEEEYVQGAKAKDTFALFLLTKDYREPQAVNIATQKLLPKYPNAKIIWIRWQRIYAILKEIEQRTELDAVSHNLLNDILALLGKKGLRGTTGLKREWLQDIAKHQEHLYHLCEELSLFVQELNYLATEKGLEPLTPGGTASNIDRDGRGYSLVEPDNWFPKYLEFAYKDKSWIGITQFLNRHLYFRLHLDTGEAFLGFILLASNANVRKDLLRQKTVISQELQAYPDLELAVVPRNWSKAHGQPFTEDARVLFDDEKLKSYEWLDFRYKLPVGALETESAVESALSRLDWIREFVYKVQLVT